MINTPSCVARLPANARRRWRTAAGSDGEWAAFQRNCTAVDTLFTFWPPGPDARTKVSVISESGMTMGKAISRIARYRRKGSISLYSRIFTAGAAGALPCSIARNACSDWATIARAMSFLWIEWYLEGKAQCSSGMT